MIKTTTNDHSTFHPGNYSFLTRCIPGKSCLTCRLRSQTFKHTANITIATWWEEEEHHWWHFIVSKGNKARVYSSIRTRAAPFQTTRKSSAFHQTVTRWYIVNHRPSERGGDKRGNERSTRWKNHAKRLGLLIAISRRYINALAGLERQCNGWETEKGGEKEEEDKTVRFLPLIIN